MSEDINKLIDEMSAQEKIMLCGCSLSLATPIIKKRGITSVKLPCNILDRTEDLSALGCTFDLALAAEKGRLMNDDAAKEGACLAGVLNVGIVREPMRCGSEKMLGEDALAVSLMSSQIVEACATPMLVGGILGGEYPFSERYIDSRALIELYLKPFIDVSSKVGGVVIPAGSLNGKLAAHSSAFIKILNKYLPNGLFINEFGSCFNGEECLKAGSLFEVGSYSLPSTFLKIQNNEVDIKLLDNNVRRILNFIIKSKKAISEQNNLVAQDDYNKKLAQESVVLLKNNAELPLAGGSKIGVFGDISKADSLCLSSNFEVIFNKGGKYPAVIFLRLSGESYTDAQRQIVENVVKCCSSAVVVLLSDRPAPLPFEGIASAILYAPVFNAHTLNSVADILYGKLNPSGKLSVTYAYSPTDYPAKMYSKAKERGMFCYESVLNGYRYFSSFSRGVLYPFGHGLSYTGFEISGYKISLQNDVVLIDFIVKNVGMVSGSAVVFVFGNIYQDNIIGLRSRLAGFKRVCLQNGSSQAAHMAVPAQAFSVYNATTCEWIIPGGKLELFAGFSAQDKRVTATIKLPYSTKYSLGLSAKDIPSYYAPDAFYPLGADVEKVMKTPLLVSLNPLEKFCKKTHSPSAIKSVKLCAKKLVKGANIKLTQANSLLENMSDFAVNKILTDV